MYKQNRSISCVFIMKNSRANKNIIIFSISFRNSNRITRRNLLLLVRTLLLICKSPNKTAVFVNNYIFSEISFCQNRIPCVPLKTIRQEPSYFADAQSFDVFRPHCLHSTTMHGHSVGIILYCTNRRPTRVLKTRHCLKTVVRF